MLLAAALASYGGTLWNGFVWDDRIILIPVEAYQAADIVKILTTPANAVEYQPIRDLTFVLDFALWGKWAPGFHLTSLLLYLANIAAVWAAASALLRGFDVEAHKVGSFLTAALFALHPWHVEVVNLIVARNSLLAGLFVWLSLLVYLRYRDSGRWPALVVSLGLFVLALGSKVDAACLPLALVFLKVRNRKNWITLTPFFALAALAAFVNAWVYWGIGRVNPEFLEFGIRNPWTGLKRAIMVPPFYLGKAFWPLGLHVSYAFEPSPSLVSWPGLLGLVCLAVFILGAWAVWKAGRGEAAFGLVWFLVFLLPYLSLLPISPKVADRYAYIASFGLALAIGTLLARRLEKCPKRLGWGAATAGLLLALGLSSFVTTGHWHQDLTLFKASLRHNPNSHIALNNMASALWRQGRRQEAQNVWPPDSPEALWYRGRILMEDDRIGEALEALELAWNAGGRANFMVGLDLAQTYEILGQPLRASFIYHKVENLPIFPFEKAKARQKLERIQGSYKPTLEDLRRRAATSINALAELALLQDRLGLEQQAVTSYTQLIALKPEDWRPFYNRANVLKRLDRYMEAALDYRRAIEQGSTTAHAYNNLGLVLLKAGQKTEGIKVLKDAVSRFPGFPFPAFNLGRYYFSRGDRQSAIHWFRRAVEAAGDDSPTARLVQKYMKEMG